MRVFFIQQETLLCLILCVLDKKAVDSGEKAQQETHCVAEHDSMMYWPQYGANGWWVRVGNTRMPIETLVEFSAYRPDTPFGGG